MLRATHAHDLDRLAEAEACLRDELAAKAARDAKAEEEAEEAAAEKALQARQLAAAITIQAAWRGYKVGFSWRADGLGAWRCEKEEGWGIDAVRGLAPDVLGGHSR